MYSRISIVMILATAAASAWWPQQRPCFMATATGAVNTTITSVEARFGLSPAVEGRRHWLTISLGAYDQRGSLSLVFPGDRLPAPGRYPVRLITAHDTLPELFHASFVAGSPERPLGAFTGESGWVTIRLATGNRMVGEFEVNARGFLAATPDDEDAWVTVSGQFDAAGDSSATAMLGLR